MNGTEAAELSGGYGLYLVQTILALGAVLLLAWVILRWGLPKLQGLGRPERLLRVVDRLPLEPRRALWLVEVGERRLLLASSEQGVVLLTEIEPSPEGEPPKTPTTRRLGDASPEPVSEESAVASSEQSAVTSSEQSAVTSVGESAVTSVGESAVTSSRVDRSRDLE